MTNRMHWGLLFAALTLAPLAALAEVQEPKFDELPSREPYLGQPRMLNFAGRADTREAFRRRADIDVTKPFAQAPDFAGHHRLVNFDCRPNIHCTYLVNLNTGRVVQLPFNVHREFLRYRDNSRLLVIEPDGANIKQRSYWLLERGVLKRIR